MRIIILALFLLCCCGSISFTQEGNGVGVGKAETNKKDAPLKILSYPRPAYTKQARKNKIEGVVRLRVTFGADKKIGDIEVIKELPDGLTEQAIKVAKQIQFVPAMKDGVAITKKFPIEYNFKLD